jgi:hypothetical protein
MGRQEYLESLKKALIQTGSKTLIRAVSTRLPFLFYGPFGAIASLLITKLVELLFNEAEMLAFIKYTDLRVDAEGRKFSEAAIKNYQAQQNGTEDEKRKCEENLIKAFKDFATISSN